MAVGAILIASRVGAIAWVGLAVDRFNQGVDRFNQGVDRFNKEVDRFNKGVDRFNKGVDQTNKKKLLRARESQFLNFTYNPEFSLQIVVGL